MDQGKKILLSAYWNSKGWKRYDVSDEDFQIAKQQGYMFDYPAVITHKEYMDRLREVCGKITPADVANAFLYSLSTRELEYRSALGSYWYAIAIPEHTWQEREIGMCDLCAWSKWYREPDRYEQTHGLSVMNFERYKWGGVRHCCGAYALFDLEQFLKLPRMEHTKEDEKILHDILECVKELQPRNKAGALQKVITGRKILKSNKQEVDVLLDILGICGVLSSKENPCYAESFSDLYHRNPPELTNDRAYPLNAWRASDGINAKRYEIVFGEVLDESIFGS